MRIGQLIERKHWERGRPACKTKFLTAVAVLTLTTQAWAADVLPQAWTEYLFPRAWAADGSAQSTTSLSASDQHKRAEAFLQLAKSFQAQKNYPVAESLYRSALSCFRANDKDSIACLNGLSTVLRAENLTAEAKSVFQHKQAAAVAFSGLPPRSSEQYIEWLKDCADIGHPSAPGLLGIAYLKGDGVPMDYNLARSFLQKSVEEGDGCGEVNLANMYLHGTGVPVDQKKAEEYFALANQYGIFFPSTGSDNNGAAEYQLGVASETGVGLRKSVANAYQWFCLAAASKSADAKDAATRLAKLQVGLAPEEKDQYDQQLATWKDAQQDATSPKVSVPTQFSW